MFGQPSNTPFGGGGGGGFGQPQNTFGQPNPQQGAFGSSNASPFGQPTTPAFGSPSPAPGGFGQTQPTSTFGGAPSPFGGGGTTGGFGQPTNTFGGTSTFGSPAPAPSGGLFGSTSTGTNTFGAPASQPFGSTGGFGAPAPSGGGLFGSSTTNTASPFGGGATTNSAPFGGTSTNTFGGGGGAFGSSTPGGQSTFGAPAPAGGGLFGSTTPSAPFGSPAPAPTGGLFGAPAPAPTGGGLFGAPQPVAPQQGGAGPGTRMAPYQPTNKEDGTTSIILNSISAMPQYEQYSHEELRAQDYAQGNRGTSTPTASNTAGGGFGFGSAPAPAFGAPAPSGGLFGSNPAPAPGGFGSTFGSPAPAPGGFGSTFGSPSPAPAFGAPAPSGGLFGSPSPAPAPFGAPAPAPGGFGSSFGAPAPAPFGAPAPAPGGFGSSFGAPAPSGGLFGAPSPAPGGFGAPAPSPGGGLFGSSAPAPGGFGAPAPSGGFGSFGAPAPSGGLFGAPSPAPGGFGAPAPSGGFGSFGAPAPSGGLFGAPSPAPGGFGAPAPFGGFGAAPAPPPYGAPAPGLFGAPAAPPTAPAIPPNTGINPPVYSAVMEQEVKSLEQQKKEFEKTEVWRGGASATASAPSSPANLSDSVGMVLGRSSRSLFASPSPRSAAKIRPRGFPKTEPPAKNASSALIGFGRDNRGTQTPEANLRSASTRLVIRPDSLSRKPLRLQLKDNGALPALSDKPANESPAAARTTTPVHRSDLPTRSTGATDTSAPPDPVQSPGARDDGGDLAAGMNGLRDSPGYDYYQKVIGSGKERSTPPAGPKRSPSVPTLTKPGYEVSPTIEELSRLSEADLATVEGFTVTRPSFGKVEWQGAIDVRGADLDAIVDIEQADISVYALHEEAGTKPPQGSKLNRPAILTFYNMFPKEGKAAASEESFDKLHRKLEKSARKAGAEFLSYERDVGVWKIKVQHFSRYAANLDDDSESDASVMDVEMETNRVQFKSSVTSPQTGPIKRQATPFKSSTYAVNTVDEDPSMSSDVPTGADFVEDVTMTEEGELIYNQVQPRATAAWQAIDEYLREPSEVLASPEKEVKTVSFENVGEEPEDVPRADRYPPDAATYRKAGSKASLFGRLGRKVGFKKTSIDMGCRMGRSFRVGWLPDGSFLSLAPGAGSNCLVKRRPVFSDQNNSADPIELLRVYHQFADSVSGCRGECPILSLPRGLDNGGSVESNDFLQKTANELAAKSMANPDAFASFSILSSFFRIDGPFFDSVDDRSHAEDSRRLTALSQLLIELCSADVDAEIAASKRTGNANHAVLAALLSGDVEKACEVASESGLFALASILSTGVAGSSDRKEHLLQFAKTGNLSQVPPDIFKCLAAVNGGQSLGFDTTSKPTDWRRQLSLRILQNPDSSLVNILDQFEADVGSGKTSDPVPSYLFGHGGRGVYSSLYRVLRCTASPDASTLADVVDPRGFSSSPHDFSIPFHLACLYAAAYPEPPTNQRLLEQLSDGYISQLLNEHSWEWAVVVALFSFADGISKSERAKKVALAKELVLRYFDPNDRLAHPKRNFLQSEVGVPKKWFEEAIAKHLAYQGDVRGSISHTNQYDLDAAVKMADELLLPGLLFQESEKQNESTRAMAGTWASAADVSLSATMGRFYSVCDRFAKAKDLPRPELEQEVASMLEDIAMIEKMMRRRMSKPQPATISLRMVQNRSVPLQQCIADVLERLDVLQVQVRALLKVPDRKNPT